MPSFSPEIIEQIDTLDSHCGLLEKEAEKKRSEFKGDLISEIRKIRAFLRLMRTLGAANHMGKVTDTLIRFRARLIELGANPQTAVKSDWFFDWIKGR
jgi:hypothetical protein